MLKQEFEDRERGRGVRPARALGPTVVSGTDKPPGEDGDLACLHSRMGTSRSIAGGHSDIWQKNHPCLAGCNQSSVPVQMLQLQPF